MGWVRQFRWPTTVRDMLEVRHVSKSYGSIRALSDVSLRVDEGEIVAVVGENGAGKTTLVRCVARVLPPDSGTVTVDDVELGRRPRDAIDRGVAVVWQDLSLCENLDVTANLFLGREVAGRVTLKAAAMERDAGGLFESLRVELPGLDRPIERLSGGQRQLVAIARATLDRPKVLLLDEPTASLGIVESRTILDAVQTLRAQGVAILLVSHQLDNVFDIADRIVVLRQGRVIADLHSAETHPDDVVALITGADVESTAGRQLRRLHSLAEQLADADESAVLPLTVSSLSGALSTDRLAIFMASGGAGDDGLRCSASLHLAPSLAAELAVVPMDGRSFVSQAASSASIVVVPNLGRMVDDAVADAASAHGLVGAWAAPIIGQSGSLAVIAGFHSNVSPLQEDQVRLLELFSTMAGAALERGRLVETLRRRNRALVGIRDVLETLAEPDLFTSGMGLALDALCRDIATESAALYIEEADRGWAARALSTGVETGSDVEIMMRNCVEAGSEVARGVVVANFEWSAGRAALACKWRDGAPPSDAGQLIKDAANSFRLAMEREATMEAVQEAAALQRSRDLERELAMRLGHELRTPLTAICGFASTMLQPDVTWPEDDKERFLHIIENEAGRMSRLVAQLFDDTALEKGALRLDQNYCDLVAVVEQAASIAAPRSSVVFVLPENCTVWGDRDRLEQVFVNLISNAFRHNPEGTRVDVRLEVPAENGQQQVVVEVVDDGAGLPDDALAYLNGETVDGLKGQGLGLRLVRGIVAAHAGSVQARAGAGTTVTVRLPIERAGTP